MINKERTKVLQTPVTTSSTNILNMEDGYLQFIDDIIQLIPTLPPFETSPTDMAEFQKTLKDLEDEYDIHFPPLWIPYVHFQNKEACKEVT